MFKPVPVGDRTRYSYARINEVLPMPHLIDIQRKSYEWFMREGLCEIFHDISPIKDFTGNLELSFEGFTLGDPKSVSYTHLDVYKRQTKMFQVFCRGAEQFLEQLTATIPLNLQ